MISNTHGGGRFLMPVVVGAGWLDQRPESTPPTYCRAFAPPLCGHGRAARHLSRRAAHPFLGSQGCVRAHLNDDVAATGRISTASKMAVPMWGCGAAIR